MRAFDYVVPKSVEEAVRLLDESGPAAVVMAGGTDLLVAMDRGDIAPQRVIHIGGLDELHYIRESGGELHVGALTTQAELASSELVRAKTTALAVAAQNCAGPGIRNLGTIGGNLGTGSPAGDLILAVAALEGRVVLRVPGGRRELTLEEFLAGPRKWASVAEEGRDAPVPGVLITEVTIPLPVGVTGSGFHKLGRRKAMTIATASAAARVVLSPDGGSFAEVGVALGSLGPTVIRAKAFEQALRGRPATFEEIAALRHLAGGDACPSPRARRASAWYRCEVAAVLAGRAVEDALAQAAGLDTAAWRASGKRRGKGIAGCIYSSTAPGVANPVAVNMQMSEDGSVVVQTGACDIGQGSTTVLTQMAAEALSIPYEQVTIHSADTGTTPYDLGTASSRLTFAGGNAVLEVAGQIKDVLRQAAAAKLGIFADDLVVADGRVRAKADPGRAVSIAEAARFAHSTLKVIPMGSGSYYPKSSPADENMQGEPIASYYYHATAAEVEVDIETGVVEVIKLCAAVDCGRAINPNLVEGQVEGGAIQAAGWALGEDAHPGLVSREGPPVDYRPDLAPVDLESYAIATSMDMPDLLGTYVEVPEPEGPYGAKAAGEIVANSAAPAIFNAIYDAVGIRLLEMPATPERVLRALSEKAPGESAAPGTAAASGPASGRSPEVERV